MPDSSTADPQLGGLRVAFAGSPQFAANILLRLIRSPYAPQLVLTQPDRQAGRGRRVQANPVKSLALEHQIALVQPHSLKGSEAEAVTADAAVDVLVVAAYGLILPATILNWPRYGCLNVHASLLPRWRGAAPIERAIMAGDRQTGVCIMQMEAGLDTGPVYQQAPLKLDSNQSSGVVEQLLTSMGGELLINVLATIDQAHAAGRPPIAPIPQPSEGVTYAHKLTSADRHLDWQHNALDLSRQIRALADRLPVRARAEHLNLQILAAEVLPQNSNKQAGEICAFTEQGLDVQTATDVLRITSAKPEGKPRALDAKALYHGYRSQLAIGERLT